MPHKHKRKADDDDSAFNLPPTQRAIPLPVGKQRGPNPAPKKRKTSGNNTTSSYGTDDTPKAFARLMAFKTRGKGLKGLDNGEPRSKKQKANADKTANANAKETLKDSSNKDTADPKTEIPKIMPGEKLSDFAQRVNQALPLTGLQKNTKKVAGAPDHRVTRHEKHLKKLQDGWRKEEARIRDKEAEARELAEEEQDELDAMWEDKTADLPPSGKKKGGRKPKRKLVAGEVETREEDPWEALRKKREREAAEKEKAEGGNGKKGGLRGVHDVVQAPPTFDRVPREIFKVKNGARVNVGNVPNSAGSLFKREQLGEERQTIIDTYRKLMAAKKG